MPRELWNYLARRVPHACANMTVTSPLPTPGWTLFVDPINQQYQWGRPAIQLAFTIFILMETWLVPIEGWLIDTYGLRTMFLVAGVLVGLGWVINAYASSLPMLYVAAVIGGIGGGMVYGGSVGNALKWFPDHRGLAAGLTAAGYGMGGGPDRRAD